MAEIKKTEKKSVKKKTTKKKNVNKDQVRGHYTKERKAAEDHLFQKENAAACKYKEEYADELLSYFSEPDYEEAFTPEGKPYIKLNPYPTFEQFAVEHHVTSRTLENWCDQSARFSSIYAMCKELQKARLVRNGLTDKYNANFAKFIASSCFGMTEKTQTDQNVTVSVTLPPEADEEAN